MATPHPQPLSHGGERGLSCSPLPAVGEGLGVRGPSISFEALDPLVKALLLLGHRPAGRGTGKRATCCSAPASSSPPACVTSGRPGSPPSPCLLRRANSRRRPGRPGSLAPTSRPVSWQLLSG